LADPEDKSYYFLSTVARAVAVLEQFINSDGELGVTEIARRTGLHKSVVHRILATLTELSMLVPGSAEGTYRLGVKALELGLSYLRHSPIDRVAESHLVRLAQQLPDMAFHVAILDGTEIVYQKSISGTQAKWPAATLGRRQQAYCTSLGKVLLAYLSPAELDVYFSNVQLRPLTPNNITAPLVLAKELEQVRSREWGFDNQEAHTGNCCVGVPIRDHTGRVMAALSLAGQTEHFDKYSRDNLVAMAKETAAAISRDLGFLTFKQGVSAVPLTMIG
jgi:DNA-binding IclR family transcriptional regulator